MTPNEIAKLSEAYRETVRVIARKSIPPSDDMLIEDCYSTAVLKFLKAPDAISEGEFFTSLVYETLDEIARYLREQKKQQDFGLDTPTPVHHDKEYWLSLDPRFRNYCTEAQKRIYDYKCGLIPREKIMYRKSKDYVGAMTFQMLIKYKRFQKIMSKITLDKIFSLKSPTLREIMALYNEGHPTQKIATIMRKNPNNVRVMIGYALRRFENMKGE